MAPSGGAPLRIGLIADIQYSDCDDGTDFSGAEHRHFRSSLEIARNAVGVWNAAEVHAVVQLGDIIDGCNTQRGASASALQTVLDVLAGINAPMGRFDLIGNHELYNVDRHQLGRSGLRCLGESGRTFYSRELGDCWEAIFLDAFETSLIGMSRESPGYQRAVELLSVHNPKVVDGTPGDWFDGLPERLHRYVPYNGAVSAEQLAWLGEALGEVQRKGRSVLVFTHVPLLSSATKPKTVAWNAEDVLALLHTHSDRVVAVIAGHDHDGGYAVDAKGIHHITMNSALTAQPGSDCFAILECHEGWAVFQSYGRACVESGTMGKGRYYEQLVLAKGAVNEPRASAPVSDAAALARARTAAKGSGGKGAKGGYAAEARNAAEGQLIEMGFAEADAKRALAQSGGAVEAAAALLLAE